MRVHREARAHGADIARPWNVARAAARDLGARAVRPPTRRLPLEEARGATLAEDLVALVGVPSYDTSAMDGYAVAGPGPWNVVGRVLAGQRDGHAALRPGQAVEIATGAPVPGGTEAVLPYEHALRRGAEVTGEARPGRHVRRAGEETARGETVLPAGTSVTPAVLGLAASLGHDALAVRRPRVAALVTGDELVHSGLPAPGTVRDAIGPLLPGMVEWAGALLEDPRHIGDGFGTMVSELSRIVTAGTVSMIVVCGASSVGPADHVRGALAELGARTVVDGVSCRPGHPQLLGHLGSLREPGPLVVGLPGNPGAALAAAVTLLVPALAALSGRADPTARSPRALPLRGEVEPHGHDTRLVAVRIEDGHAVPVGHDRPGTLRGAAMADALAVIPPGWSPPEAELVWLPR
ncbi:molybdopterin molybdotransferase MoeA [Marinactinospora thermotolerans]|uniref:Molybdopterin molybdenumtransferase n=1 Tax=Marinactinospora thermotolerans DSM 45154 TaxID=1122192 RepID=A0A1T4SLI0_9ACTN|nr:molybdopterin molybdotransferase MoeA [Marinactinospora thermotolerans]SKA29150.1 molybdopterin molybdotransferase [Marinactinospora thermotolerans DSM 45154]